MKKWIITGFYFILTIGISMAGFLLPSSLSAYQDQQIASTVEHPAIEPLQMTYSSSLLETLRLITGGCYFVDYPFTGSSHTSDEIYEIALNVIKQMKKHGLSFFDFSQPGVSHTDSLALAISLDDNSLTNHINSSIASSEETAADKKKKKDMNTALDDTSANGSDIATAIIWACCIYSEDGYWINLKIDDKSGKIVGMSMYTQQTEAAIYRNKNETPDTFADSCAKFLEDYYGLPMQLEPIRQTDSDLNEYYGKQVSVSDAPEETYLIHFEDTESGTRIDLPLRLQTDYAVLNIS